MNFQYNIAKRKKELMLMNLRLQGLKEEIDKKDNKFSQVETLVQCIKLGLLANMNLSNYDGIVTYCFSYCKSNGMYLSGEGNEMFTSDNDTTIDIVKALPNDEFTWPLLISLCQEEGIYISINEYESPNPRIKGQVITTVMASIDLTQNKAR